MDRQTRINQAIAREIEANAAQVAAAVKLLEDGATVPFIARYCMRWLRNGGTTVCGLRRSSFSGPPKLARGRFSSTAAKILPAHAGRQAAFNA